MKKSVLTNLLQFDSALPTSTATRAASPKIGGQSGGVFADMVRSAGASKLTPKPVSKSVKGTNDGGPQSKKAKDQPAIGVVTGVILVPTLENTAIENAPSVATPNRPDTATAPFEEKGGQQKQAATAAAPAAAVFAGNGASMLPPKSNDLIPPEAELANQQSISQLFLPPHSSPLVKSEIASPLQPSNPPDDPVAAAQDGSAGNGTRGWMELIGLNSTVLQKPSPSGAPSKPLGSAGLLPTDLGSNPIQEHGHQPASSKSLEPEGFTPAPAFVTSPAQIVARVAASSSSEGPRLMAGPGATSQNPSRASFASSDAGKEAHGDRAGQNPVSSVKTEVGRITPDSSTMVPVNTAVPSQTSGNTSATSNVLPQAVAAANPSPADSAAPPREETQPRPVTDPPLPPPPTVGGVQGVRLVDAVGHSEMHIDLRTQAFGSVEVHTVIRDSQLGLAMGSEKGDLRTLLATEVPGLQMSFREQDLRFDKIHFLDTGVGFGARSSGENSHSRSFNQQQLSTRGFSGFDPIHGRRAIHEIAAHIRSGLNVHA